tara:strand:- start:484 stop:753 length:270 start_codon:yes stop_codon:yes gene_type:complete
MKKRKAELRKQQAADAVRKKSFKKKVIAGIIIILISITLAFIFGEKKEAIKEKVTQTIVEKTVESVVDKTANDVKEKAVEKITDLFNNK